MSVASTLVAARRAEARRNFEWTPAALALLVFVLCLATPAVLNDGDTFWHIAVGDWILSRRVVPTTDPFSFSLAGAPWTAHEWLSEVLMALAFRLGGWSGVVIMTAAAFAGAVFIMTRRMARDLDGVALLALATLGLCLIVPSVLARPHILTLPILAGWTAGLLAARDEKSAPPFALLPLMTLWANLHGGFVFGLALLGPFALEALLEAPAEKRLAVARDWILFGLLALGAALLNPRGVEALIFPFQLMGMKSLSGIGEWRPESFDHVGGLEVALLALLVFVLHKPTRVPLLRLILLVGLIHLALHQTRHAMILGVVGPMLLARPVAEALDVLAPQLRLPNRAQAAAALALFVALAGARLAFPIAREDGPMAPIAALDAVPQRLREHPVLNHYDFGGYLIFSGVRPYIDGRTDMYGDAFLNAFDRLAGGDEQELNRVIDGRGIEWTIFPPGSPVVRMIDARPGWVRLHSDAYAVVQARSDAAPPALRK